LNYRRRAIREKQKHEQILLRRVFVRFSQEYCVIQRTLILGALLLSSICAFGQVVPEATAGSAPLNVGVFYSFFDSGYASTKVSGIGTYVDFSPLLSGNLGVEGEARWLMLGTSHSFSEYHYLVGPRYRIYPGDHFQPYAKFLVGAGEINFPYQLAHGGYFAMAPGGGLEYQKNGRWKLRIDYEYQIWPDGLGIPGLSKGSVKPNGVSAGISYRLFR
jgi:opacity protein-like surface antigen